MAESMRKTFYIKKEFQREIIIKFCVLAAIACLVFGGIIYLFSLTSVTTSFEKSRLVVKSTANFILPSMLFSFVFILIVLNLAVVYVVKHLSHSIAGPIFRFEEQIKRMTRGDFTNHINLRSTDQFMELSSVVNDLNHGLNDKIKHIQQQAGVIDEVTRDGSAEVRSAIQDLITQLQTFKTH